MNAVQPDAFFLLTVGSLPDRALQQRQSPRTTPALRQSRGTLCLTGGGNRFAPVLLTSRKCRHKDQRQEQAEGTSPQDVTHELIIFRAHNSRSSCSAQREKKR